METQERQINKLRMWDVWGWRRDKYIIFTNGVSANSGVIKRQTKTKKEETPAEQQSHTQTQNCRHRLLAIQTRGRT